jgi:myo-inositol-1(or 4)-monophosphatase
MNRSTATLDEVVVEALGVATEAAKCAGKKLLCFLQDDTYWTQSKEDTSLQTAADIAAEEVILSRIQKAFPDHHIKSEERGSLSSFTPSLYRWNIDPLDGTENFVLGIPYFSSCLTLYYEQTPLLAVVYNPVTDELFTATEGGAWLNGKQLAVSQQNTLQRSRAFFIPDFVTKRQSPAILLRESLYHHCRRVLDTWSPALDWCLVASGKADFVVTFANGSADADASAGMFILKQAGGEITDFSGHPYSPQNRGQIVGSNKNLHALVLKLIKEVKGHDCNGNTFD